MGNFARIIQLHVERKKSFRIILGIELLLIMLGIMELFGKNAVYEYSVSDMSTDFGTYSAEYDGLYVDSSMNLSGDLVILSGISLPRGTYRVQLHYATDTEKNFCEVTDTKLSSQLLQTNGATLFSGLNKTDYDMWLYRGANGLTIHAKYMGDGFLAVSGLTIVQTNAMTRMCLFGMFCLTTLTNCVYLYAAYDREYRTPPKTRQSLSALERRYCLPPFP